MEDRCVLCDEPMGLVSVVRVAGDVEHPEPIALCERCGFLPAEKRKRMRDQAMTRMLTSGDA
jgi:hypothetical protein